MSEYSRRSSRSCSTDTFLLESIGLPRRTTTIFLPKVSHPSFVLPRAKRDSTLIVPMSLKNRKAAPTDNHRKFKFLWIVCEVQRCLVRFFSLIRNTERDVEVVLIANTWYVSFFRPKRRISSFWLHTAEIRRHDKTNTSGHTPIAAKLCKKGSTWNDFYTTPLFLRINTRLRNLSPTKKKNDERGASVGQWGV